MLLFVSIHCRVVHVSSMASKMAINGCSEMLRNQLKACRTIADLSGFMTKFVTWVDYVDSYFCVGAVQCSADMLLMSPRQHIIINILCISLANSRWHLQLLSKQWEASSPGNDDWYIAYAMHGHRGWVVALFDDRMTAWCQISITLWLAYELWACNFWNEMVLDIK